MASSRLPVPVVISTLPMLPEPDEPPPEEPLPWLTFFLEPPMLPTMAAMATPSATAAAATIRPIGMPKTVALSAAEMAVSIPSNAAPIVPTMVATPAKMVGKLDSRPPLRP